MSTDAPPAFPRIPHLVEPEGGARDDLVLTSEVLESFLARPSIVEEKLDGANVSVQLDELGRPVARTRSGKTSGDRGGQLGRLKAWAAERLPQLQAVLADCDALYAEWLFRSHSLRYDRLPDLLVVLDLWRAGGGFLGAAERDARCRAAGLVTPPVLFTGVLGNLDALRHLHGRSRFGSELAEGLVVRLEADDRPGRCGRTRGASPGTPLDAAGLRCPARPVRASTGTCEAPRQRRPVTHPTRPGSCRTVLVARAKWWAPEFTRRSDSELAEQQGRCNALAATRPGKASEAPGAGGQPGPGIGTVSRASPGEGE